MSVNPRAPKGKAPPGGRAGPIGSKNKPAGAGTGSKPGSDDAKAGADKAAAATDGKATTAGGAGAVANVDLTTAHKRSQMEMEFDRLKSLDKLEDGVDAIGPKGLQQLCTDLGLTYNDLDMFVVVWKLGATQSYCITRSEWLHGVYSWDIEHMGKMKTISSDWKKKVKEDEGAFTEMYYSLYDFIRGEDEKLLPQEKAIKAWHVLLPEPNVFSFLTLWVQWVTLEYKRNITRDVWRQVWEFARRIKSLDQYDSNDKWPTALDDFVEWAIEKQAITKKVAGGANH